MRGHKNCLVCDGTIELDYKVTKKKKQIQKQNE